MPLRATLVNLSAAQNEVYSGLQAICNNCFSLAAEAMIIGLDHRLLVMALQQSRGLEKSFGGFGAPRTCLHSCQKMCRNYITCALP